MTEKPLGIDSRPRRGDAFRLLWRSMTLKPVRELVCRRCYYPVRGLTRPVCPECGGDLTAEGSGVLEAGRVPVWRTVVWVTLCLIAWSILVMAGYGFSDQKVCEYLQPWHQDMTVKFTLTPSHDGYHKIVVIGKTTLRGYGYEQFRRKFRTYGDYRAAKPRQVDPSSLVWEYELNAWVTNPEQKPSAEASTEGNNQDTESAKQVLRLAVDISKNRFHYEFPIKSGKVISGEYLDCDRLMQVLEKCGIVTDYPLYELDIHAILLFFDAYSTGKDCRYNGPSVILNQVEAGLNTGASGFITGNYTYEGGVPPTRILFEQIAGRIINEKWILWLVLIAAITLWFCPFIYLYFRREKLLEPENSPSSSHDILPTLDVRDRFGDGFYLMWRRLTLRPLTEVSCRRCGTEARELENPVCPRCAGDLHQGGIGVIDPLRYPSGKSLILILLMIGFWMFLGAIVGSLTKTEIDYYVPKEEGRMWAIMKASSRYDPFTRFLVTGRRYIRVQDISEYDCTTLGLDHFQIIIWPKEVSAVADKEIPSTPEMPNNQILGVTDQCLIMEIELHEGSLRYRTLTERQWLPFKRDTSAQVILDWLRESGIPITHEVVLTQIQHVAAAIHCASRGQPYVFEKLDPYSEENEDIRIFDFDMKRDSRMSSSSAKEEKFNWSLGHRYNSHRGNRWYLSNDKAKWQLSGSLSTDICVVTGIWKYPSWWFYLPWYLGWGLVLAMIWFMAMWYRLWAKPVGLISRSSDVG